MNTLVIDRSTLVQSAAFVADGTVENAVVLDGLDSRSGAWAAEVLGFAAGRRIDRIVVGTGPGSFAGIRSALAFAQGYAIGSGAAVYGLTSAAALAREGEKLVVVGDSRRGKCWTSVFDGLSQKGDVVQTGEESLRDAVPPDAKVVTPDAARIGEKLKSVFGERFAGGRIPLAVDLARFFLADPSALVAEPLPVYLNKPC